MLVLIQKEEEEVDEGDGKWNACSNIRSLWNEKLRHCEPREFNILFY